MAYEQKYVVIVELDKEACPWLRDAVVKVGTIVTETADIYGCCGPDGTFVKGGGLSCNTELPTAALCLLTEEVDDSQIAGTPLN